MVNLLTRDAILGASDIKTEDVSVPEWGGTVRVKGLTAAERDEFESGLLVMTGEGKNQKQSVSTENARARLASFSIVDEEGKRVFTGADVILLGKKSGAALSRVFDVATRLSGISDDDIEELTKNSEADQSDDSPSA